MEQQYEEYNPIHADALACFGVRFKSKEVISMEGGKKPALVISAGSVRAAVWTNTINKDGREVGVHSVQIDRSYLDKDGSTWRRTSKFNLHDLPRVELVARKSFEALVLKKAAEDKE